MNRAEKKILRQVIFCVAHHNKYLWWEIKRQIWDHGFQVYYPRQGEFDQAAERALKALGTPERQALVLEWRNANAHQLETPEEIVLSYVPLVIEEVVKRATTAAYRTTNW